MNKYENLSTSYKIERMKEIFRILDSGNAVSVNGLYLEEIKYLKSLYGKELKKDGGLIYRAMEMEVLF